MNKTNRQQRSAASTQGATEGRTTSSRRRFGRGSPRSHFGLLCGLSTCLAIGCSHTPDPIDQIKTLGGKVATDPADKTLAAKVSLDGSDCDDVDMQIVGKCRRLRELNLSRTQVTDEGLKQLAGMAKLQVLDLSDTAITDAGIGHLKGLPALARLLLAKTKITDAGLSTLTTLPKLRELDVNGTAVTDAGMATVAKITALRVLSANNTKVTSAGVESLHSLTGLEQLRLAGTAVDDRAVKTISGMTALKTLAVSRTHLSAEGEAAIQKALPKLSKVRPPAAKGARNEKAVAVRGVIRVKAGSAKPFRDSSGNVWQADLGFKGGKMYLSPNGAIANTKDAGLYLSEHHSMDSFAIDAPNGKYIARLHFAENHETFTKAGQRVFSFNVQGHEFKDFDIWQKAGGTKRAYVESVPVEVSNGKFTITFTKRIDNPTIDAIELARQGDSTQPTPVAVQGVIRIKAGSTTPFTDSNGNVWQADLGFGGGDISKRPVDATIAGTQDAGLYLTEHWGMDSFSCRVPNGKYLAKLYFAESYKNIKGEGQRVFSFNIQGHEFNNFDIWQRAGGANRAYVESVPVEVTDGTFTITFKSEVQNPKINAIELVPQTGLAPAKAAATAPDPTASKD